MTLFWDDIQSAAARTSLDPYLVAGVLSVESSFNQYAWNPEPKYRYFWNVKTKGPFRTLTAAEIETEDAPTDFPSLAGDRDQEWWGQSASWGLMQIMGAVARQQGFRGLYLPELVDPIVNLQYGCAQLSDLMRWAKNDPEQACASYNGGKVGNGTRPFRNQAYASLVLAARARLKV